MIRQLIYEKENCELKAVKHRLKIDLVSNPTRAEDLVNIYTIFIQTVTRTHAYTPVDIDFKLFMAQGQIVRVLDRITILHISLKYYLGIPENQQSNLFHLTGSNDRTV